MSPLSSASIAMMMALSSSSLIRMRIDRNDRRSSSTVTAPEPSLSMVSNSSEYSSSAFDGMLSRLTGSTVMRNRLLSTGAVSGDWTNERKVWSIQPRAGEPGSMESVPGRLAVAVAPFGVVDHHFKEAFTTAISPVIDTMAAFNDAILLRLCFRTAGLPFSSVSSSDWALSLRVSRSTSSCSCESRTCATLCGAESTPSSLKKSLIRSALVPRRTPTGRSDGGADA
jgi:hypothetical protein